MRKKTYHLQSKLIVFVWERKNSYFIIPIHSNLYLELTTKKLSNTNNNTDIKNVIGKLKWHGRVEGFQTSTHHGGYLDLLVDPIEIEFTVSPTLRPRIYGCAVVSQSLGPCNPDRVRNHQSSKRSYKNKFIEQLLATLTGTCVPPHHPPGLGEDSPLSPPPVCYLDR